MEKQHQRDGCRAKLRDCRRINESRGAGGASVPIAIGTLWCPVEMGLSA